MYEHILVPIDGSSAAECGLLEAIRLAQTGQSVLHLLHVVEMVPLYGEMMSPALVQQLHEGCRERGRALLDEAEKRVAEYGLGVETTLRESAGRRVADVIVEELGRGRFDLVVIGTHGRRGISRLALGSDAENVVRRCPIPVLLVREPAPAQ